jgi:flagellar basal-body rod modification protein FlgD
VDLSFMMSDIEKQNVQMQVDTFNKTVNQGREAKSELNKDDFLQILITQLTHQDPTRPMEDKEFIAQMAQFSTLEQMTNMSSEFEKLARVLSANNALGLLGKTVDISEGNHTVTGVVEEITGGDFPQLLVGGSFYDYARVTSIKE